MASIDITGRPAYMYDQETNTWYAISGRVATGANYIWTGSQQYTNQVIFSSSINCFLNPAARTAAISSPAVGLITFVQQDAGGATINRFEYWTGSVWTPIADPNAATKSGVETLTNKTMSGANNTFTNIPATSITGLDQTLQSLSSVYSPLNTTVNAQTASYTLVLTDTAKMIEISNASANTLTIPPASSVNFPLGTNIIVCQTGAGQTTLTAGSGVTLNGTPGLKLRAQWSSATLIKRASDTWLAIGDLSA